MGSHPRLLNTLIASHCRKNPDDPERIIDKYKPRADVPQLQQPETLWASVWQSPECTTKLTLDIHATRRRASTSEVKAFKRAIFKALKPLADRLDEDQLYTLYLKFYLPVYHKNGSLKREDVSNFVKVAEDGICTALGIDDCQFMSVRCDKIHSDTTSWWFEIERFEDGQPE